LKRQGKKQKRRKRKRKRKRGLQSLGLNKQKKGGEEKKEKEKRGKKKKQAIGASCSNTGFDRFTYCSLFFHFWLNLASWVFWFQNGFFF
jgi:hypothetical protein